jgi:hypothetical protein
MVDLSLAGLAGAVVGIIVAAFAYVPLVRSIERGFRARQPSGTAEEQATIELELSLLRRAVLAVDIIVFAGIGYWLAQRIAG